MKSKECITPDELIQAMDAAGKSWRRARTRILRAVRTLNDELDDIREFAPDAHWLLTPGNLVLLTGQHYDGGLSLLAAETSRESILLEVNLHRSSGGEL